ncbi:hypothetical protein ACI7RC_06300 [Brevibacillus sp. B_LB10_24]|uniref:hypothetical protein n=1 Tax=Brevibacillus sp. B_LB10_24 TaxID=3380645 RepID=UPI0038BBD8E3
MMTILVRNALTDKLAILRQPGGPDLALVRPVRLPVQLDDRELWGFRQRGNEQSNAELPNVFLV